jgi:hypothetical protein
MKASELLAKLNGLLRQHPESLEVAAEYFEIGEGKNIAASVTDVVIENGKLVLVTDRAA